MVSNVRYGRLGDFAETCLGKMLDKKKNKGVFYPYLGNKNVRWGCFDTNDLASMRFEDHEHERYGLIAGDLIVCEGGEPGRCAIWKNQSPNMKIQKALHRIRPNKELNNQYLYYWFLWAGKNERLEPYFTGTTIKHLTGKSLSDLEIPIPAIQRQESITNILSSLDNKIQLNYQTNQTLEQMAQALFKSWFVDFDPVIDNALAAGNPIPEPLLQRAAIRKAQGENGNSEPSAGLSKELCGLFPSEFEHSEELGWVPKGWEVDQLKKHIQILNGFAFKSKDYTKEGTFVLRTKNFKNGITQKLNDDVHLPSAFLSTHKAYLSKPYDYHLVMVGNSLGNRGIIFPQQLPALRNQNMWCFRTKDETVISQVYVKCLLDSIVNKSLGLASGSAREFFRKGDFGDQSICIGSQGAQSTFQKVCFSYIQQQGILNFQISMLTKLRDTLLPKLISGELRIPGVEQVEAQRQNGATND